MASDTKSVKAALDVLQTDLTRENWELFQSVARPLFGSREELSQISRKAGIGLGIADVETWIHFFNYYQQKGKLFLAMCCAEAIWLRQKNSVIHDRYEKLTAQFEKRHLDQLGHIRKCFSKNKIMYDIAVIMPTYNRHQEIRSAIKSVLEQTFGDYELIVVNDGGTSDCQRVVDSFHSEKIRYLEVRHGGLSHALNQGVLNSRSRYICYLDDDDLYYPDHLETVASALESSGKKVVYTDGCRVTLKKEGQILQQVAREVAYSVDFNPGMLSEWNYLPILCVGHRRDCVEKIGLFETELGNMMDWDLWVRFSRQYDFCHIDRVTCQYLLKKSNDSLSGNRINHHFYEALLRNHFEFQARQKWGDISQNNLRKGMDYDDMEASIFRYTNDHLSLATWLIPWAYTANRRGRARQLVAGVVRSKTLKEVLSLPTGLYSRLSFRKFFLVWWDMVYFLLIRLGRFIMRKLGF